MRHQSIGYIRIRARTPRVHPRVVVVTEDPQFWITLRREIPELESDGLLAQSAREGLVAVEDPRVKVAVLDGSLQSKPANQLLDLIKQIRPQIAIVFGYREPNDEWERQAREAGVLYYGDRTRCCDLARVIRRSLGTPIRSAPSRRQLRAKGRAQ